MVTKKKIALSISIIGFCGMLISCSHKQPKNRLIQESIMPHDVSILKSELLKSGLMAVDSTMAQNVTVTGMDCNGDSVKLIYLYSGYTFKSPNNSQFVLSRSEYSDTLDMKNHSRYDDCIDKGPQLYRNVGNLTYRLRARAQYQSTELNTYQDIFNSSIATLIANGKTQSP